MSGSIMPVTKHPALLTLQSPGHSEKGSEPLGFLCFQLGNEEYGVDLKLVCQVVKPPPLTWVPRLPSHLLGVISIRGAVVTLVDLRQLMGLSATEWPRKSRVLIVEIGDEQIGLLVDGVSQVRRIGAESIEKKPSLKERLNNDYIIFVARPDKEKKPILIVDLDTVLLERLR
jgi:chemotaxis signal transduction protein